MMMFRKKTSSTISCETPKTSTNKNTNNSVTSLSSVTLSPNNRLSERICVASTNSRNSKCGGTDSYNVRYVRNSTPTKRNSQKTYMNKGFYKDKNQVFLAELKEEQQEELKEAENYLSMQQRSIALGRQSA